MIRVKDYLITDENLYFAVVMDGQEDDRYLCTLRYAKFEENRIQKFSTDQASQFLQQGYARYLFHSRNLDVDLHAVPEHSVRAVLKPVDLVQKLLKSAESEDKKLSTAQAFLRFLEDSDINTDQIGITGSLLPGFHNDHSDIDVVIYCRPEFEKVREVVKQLLESKPEYRLSDDLWRDAWERRDCTLGFPDYLWHERRKFNKLDYQGSRIDISCVPEKIEESDIRYPVTKRPIISVETKVLDDTQAFSYPARYKIEHDGITEILVYSATYIGQAFTDERIEARGPIEIDKNGVARMIIGTSREARGEYIRVIRNR